MSNDSEIVIKALENPKFTWRTVRGISKETGLKQDSVQYYLYKQGGKIVKSSARNTKGELLFASRKVYRTKAGHFRRFASAIKNRGD
ncbi:MAG: hypothetical protein ACUZ8I_02095 [Candidatus Scalindua sp.]